MANSKRLGSVKILIEGGHIKEFREIFDYIPKTAVAENLGIHFNRMTRMIDNVSDIKINDLFLISGHLGVDAKLVFDLVYNQRGAPKKGTRKK